MNNISNGYENITVEVIDYNKQLAEHAWNCYRMTWKKLQNVSYDENNTDVIDAINNIIEMKALPMPREQALITFRINNISRVCLAQLTRQRNAAFNVESQMPAPVEHNVILPLNIVGSKFEERARKLIKASQTLYNELIEDGIPPQDARYLLMHGQTTSLVYVVDIDTFVRSFTMRCENNLSDELNFVYRLCKFAILTTITSDKQFLKIDNLTYKMYNEIISPADCLGAKQHKGMNYDKVFGNSFERYESANDKIKSITSNCDYNYKKSAWYKELKRLPDCLLFADERQMIDKM